MKKISICLIVLLVTGYVFSQKQQDSLVVFSGLKFQSEFEKNAFHNYVINHKDTLDLFLAIDKGMTKEVADSYKNTYNKVIADLNGQKINSKSIVRRIKYIMGVRRFPFSCYESKSLSQTPGDGAYYGELGIRF